jgi:hypothetical protein
LRCLVGEYQYFFYTDYVWSGFWKYDGNVFQSRTKMMELYMSSQPKLSSSYNVEHVDTIFHGLMLLNDDNWLLVDI